MATKRSVPDEENDIQPVQPAPAPAPMFKVGDLVTVPGWDGPCAIEAVEPEHITVALGVNRGIYPRPYVGVKPVSAPVTAKEE